MRTTKIYDVPTRIFHWIFAGLFVFAFTIAQTVDDESKLFVYHMLAGLLLGFVVTMRLVWGVVGTRHARLSDFALAPREFFLYAKDVLSGGTRKWAGHNPASSWAALAMMALALALGATGLLMTTGAKETFEDVHEVLSKLFLITAGLHVAGVVFHMLRHRDGIAFSMLDGNKQGVPKEAGIPRSRRLVGVVFVLLILGFSGYLARQYDSASGSLSFFGVKLSLAKAQDAEAEE